tara:strand:+ start:1233 stop:2633 length:1401 start_codon:yes stop_codon:yes gene_type:complete
MGSTILLARMLTPGDFGLVGMVTVLLQLINFIKDFGLVQATVQRFEINRQQISNLFWINLFASFGMACVFAVCAPLIAQFYNQPDLVDICLILSIGVLIQGLSLQHRALMQRKMQFVKLAVIDIIAQIFSVCIALYMANSGWGFWSLVVLPVVPAIVNSTILPIMTRWIPQMPKSSAGTKPFLTYGTNLFGFNLLNYFSRNADNILIGKFVGAEALGYYANAYKLLMLPMQQINSPVTNAVLPSLSRLQNDPVKFKILYTNALRVVAIFTIPLVVFSFAFADVIVMVVLGLEWMPAAEIFRLLSPAAFIAATNVASGWVFMSTATTNRQLRLGIINSALIVIGMLVGISWGFKGVAVAISIVTVIVRLPSIIYCFHNTHLKLKDFIKPQLFPVIASVVSIGVAYVVKVFINLSSSESMWMSLGFIICAFVICYFALCFIIYGSLNLKKCIWLVWGKHEINDKESIK